MTILHAVLQKLTRKSTEINASEVTPQAVDIAKLANRHAPLIRLLESRQLLEVVIEGHAYHYQSMILDIDLSNGLLLLDDLFPAGPSLSLVPGSRLTIRHHLNGEILTFNTTLVRVNKQLETPSFVVHLPEEVGYRHRRIHPRWESNRQHPLPVKFQSPIRSNWFATIHNLSAGGMRVAIAGNELQYLERGVLLPKCEFTFNQDFQINCQARVRSFRFVRRPYRHTQVSVEFVDLPLNQRVQLQQFINAMGPAHTLAA